MNMVEKRDGQLVRFDKNKIENAILSAFVEVYEEETGKAIKVSKKIADEIALIDKNLSVEAIQNLVEEKLMEEDKDVAKSYILYRQKRNEERSKKSVLKKNIDKRIKKKDEERQNANVDGDSFGGKMGAINSDVMKEYALYNCMSDMARENHLKNEIYIHDLDSYAVGMHNCLSIPFDDILANGFITRQTDVRPANSINTAFQLVAVIFQLQSLQQFGGVSATHLDWTMVPYVQKSFKKHYIKGLKYCENGEKPEWIDTVSSIDSDEYKLYKKAYNYAMEQTIDETRQAVEGMFHNLNTLQSRSGNQLPFTSINFGTCTLPEGRMVIEALLNGSIKGVGKHHLTSIFPCSIFQCMKGVNRAPGDPNYDLFQLALRSTAQRLYPNYANVDWSGNEGYDINDPRTYFSTMGCRTANGYDINAMPGQNPQLKDGRGNICPVTIILPTLAMEASHYYDNKPCGDLEEDTIDFFMELLDKKIHEAKDMLIERFEYICNQSPESAKFMWQNGTMYGYNEEEGIRSALKHGTLAIGQIGLAETLQILVECNQTTEKGMKLAKRIEQLFKDRCAEFKHEYSLNFGVYYTPAENLCFTAMKKFQEQYGEIPNVSDKKFFTNSIHVPVWEEVTPIEKINIESQLTGYSSAGCITYVELDGSVKNNLQALETLVNYAMDKDIPYFAVNIPNDSCMDCGYTDDLNDTCPECGGHHIRRLRRVAGYLTGDYLTAFNDGKKQETELRIKHNQVHH